MGRKKKSGSITWTSILFLLALGIIFSYPYISMATGLAVLACWLIYRYLGSRKNLPDYDLSEIDALEGSEFEEYIASLFCNLGYKAHATKKSRDFGVDVVAHKGAERLAIQTKRYSQAVSLKAVQEVVAGMHKYNCNKSMVLTNNYFTSSAIELAEHSSCELVDRDGLARLIMQAQADSSQQSSSKAGTAKINESYPKQKVIVLCPNCGQQLRLPAGRTGNVKCPSCGEASSIST
jgi:restriction system protein